jgi:O-methyltransferase
MKRFLKTMISSMGYDIRRKSNVGEDGLGTIRARPDPESHLPDSRFYQPVFSPWLGYGDFATYYQMAQPLTLISPDRCYMLYSLALQALNLPGNFWECGVYRGGTAVLLANLIDEKVAGFRHPRLRLFDTFEGMPETDPQRDRHRKGDFSDTSLETVKERIGKRGIVSFHPGFIPDSFRGLENESIALAHIDVDIYTSVIACCEFVYSRTLAGGFLIFDDYGFSTCPGARKAVDDYFMDKPEVPLVLPTGQAVVVKLPVNAPYECTG